MIGLRENTDEVVKFIRRRFKTDCDWISGNCYYFAVILKARFPQAAILYDVIDGHFFVKIGKHYYDWRGEIELPSKCVFWDDMDIYDHFQTKRIIRDCIL